MSSNPLPDSRGRLNLLPTTLTGRLVLTSITMVAAVSIVVGLVTTLALRSFLLDRLDEQVANAAVRVEGTFPGGPDDVLPPDRLCLSGDRGPGGSIPGQGPGALNGILDGSCPHAEVVTERGYRQSLSEQALHTLERTPVDAAPHGVDIPGVGSYHVIVRKIGDSLVVTGLPTREVDETLGRLIGVEAIVALVFVALAAVVVRTLVHRQLRPLREVAATAAEVTRTPLDTGAVGTTARVPDEFAHPDNEVGQLGEALNRMLGHVERALDARHESEQQVRQFLADASHELRTPLATIAGYAELSRRSPLDDPAQLAQLQHAMSRVDVESSRMKSLVDDLLLLARLDSGRPLETLPVDLSLLTVEALNDARVMSPDHQWRLVLPDEPAVVTGDERRLHQVVANLLSNARRHTPPGTVVTVSIDVGGGRGEVCGDSPEPPDEVMVTIDDDGPGLTPAFQEHAFERFTRGDASRARDTGGAGLGLPIVKAIIEAHGGTVTVTSRPGDTSFVVRLPRSDG